MRAKKDAPLSKDTPLLLSTDLEPGSTLPCPPSWFHVTLVPDVQSPRGRHHENSQRIPRWPLASCAASPPAQPELKQCPRESADPSHLRALPPVTAPGLSQAAPVLFQWGSGGGGARWLPSVSPAALLHPKLRSRRTGLSVAQRPAAAETARRVRPPRLTRPRLSPSAGPTRVCTPPASVCGEGHQRLPGRKSWAMPSPAGILRAARRLPRLKHHYPPPRAPRRSAAGPLCAHALSLSAFLPPGQAPHLRLSLGPSPSPVSVPILPQGHRGFTRGDILTHQPRPPGSDGVTVCSQKPRAAVALRKAQEIERLPGNTDS